MSFLFLSILTSRVSRCCFAELVSSAGRLELLPSGRGGGHTASACQHTLSSTFRAVPSTGLWILSGSVSGAFGTRFSFDLPMFEGQLKY